MVMSRFILDISCEFQNSSYNSTHCRSKRLLAFERARMHSARLPCASIALARARVCSNVSCACCSACFTDFRVGCRPSLAPRLSRAVGPASGFFPDARTDCSNAAICSVQGPAPAATAPEPKIATTIKPAEIRELMSPLARPAAALQSIGWCPGEDSNLHGFHHWYLKPARLPIPPPGLSGRYVCQLLSACQIAPAQPPAAPLGLAAS